MLRRHPIRRRIEEIYVSQAKVQLRLLNGLGLMGLDASVGLQLGLRLPL